MDKDKLKTLKKFVNDPDWKEMEQFISDRMNIDESVNTLDMTKHPSVIMGDIAARQLLSRTKTVLFKNFGEIAAYDPDKQPRRTLK